MAKTVQLLAVVGTVAEDAKQKMAQLTHLGSQEGLFDGLDQTYQKRFEDGADLAPKHKRLRVTAAELTALMQQVLTRHWDLALTLDTANAAAKADIVVGTVTLARDVPVGHLLWLARELDRIRLLVAALPVLDTKYDWPEEGEVPGTRKSNAVTTDQRDKVPGRFVLYEATKEHAAQVQRLDTDQVIGTWTTVAVSGALPQRRKDELLARVDELTAAVKMAREGANTAEAPDQHEGEALLKWILRP
jgi:hypothetical protein